MVQTGLYPKDESSCIDLLEDDGQEWEPSFLDKMRCLEDAVTRHPLNREILYAVLKYCETERALFDVEDFIASLPQFKNATQNQYRMIQVLERAYGLRAIEYDAQGEVIDPTQKAAMTEDEIDDLVADYSYQTTEVGVKFVEQHRPEARIIELLDLVPERADTYKDVLSYIGESPRSYNEICQLLEGHSALETVVNGRNVTMQPSVFLDKLERSGALVWDGKWVLTKEGGVFLDELKNR